MFMKRLTIVLCVAVIVLIASNSSYADSIVIRKDTEVLLKVIDRIHSKQVNQGDILRFLVERAVRNEDGFVLIEQGAYAYGTVTKSSRAGMFGTSGNLEISIDRVEAYNGKEILLRGSKEDEGSSSTGAVVAGAILVSPLAVFFRGSDAVVPSGTILRAYVDKTTVLFEDTTPKVDVNRPRNARDVMEYIGIVVSPEKTKEGGFVVLEVIPGGLSHLAGVHRGDILVKVDANELQEHDIERVASYIDFRIRQKAMIKATMLRNNQPRVFEIQL